MENFVYETPTKVYFGKEEELNVGKIIAGYAPKKVLVHFGGQSARKSGLLDRVEKALEAEGIAYVELGGVTANPELKRCGKVSHSANGKTLILYWQSVEVLYWILLKILQTVWPIRILTCGIFPLENVYRRKHCEKVRF